MKTHNVDVIILGAGTAGLSAAEEVTKHTKKNGCNKRWRIRNYLRTERLYAGA